jgi:hypothetical protein
MEVVLVCKYKQQRGGRVRQDENIYSKQLSEPILVKFGKLEKCRRNDVFRTEWLLCSTTILALFCFDTAARYWHQSSRQPESMMTLASRGLATRLARMPRRHGKKKLQCMLNTRAAWDPAAAC